MNGSAANVTFVLEDQTNRYTPAQNTTIYVERALNISGSTKFVVVASDRFDALGEKSFTLLQDERYRLRVRSVDGNERILGPYTAVDNQAAALSIGKLTFSPTSDSVRYSAAYYNVTDSYQGQGLQKVVHFQYRDTANATDSLRVIVYEDGNRSNELLNDSYDPIDPYGTFAINETVTGANANKSWAVEFRADRPSGNGDRRDTLLAVGGTRFTIDNPLSGEWAGLLVVSVLGFVATLVGGVGSIGAIMTAGVAAVLWWTGYYPASGGVVVLALLVAVMYRTGEGARR
jgi:hypothetical protein